MSLQVQNLAKTILAAMEGVFDERWPEIKDYAIGESNKLAQSLMQITTLRLSNQISEGECSVLLEMQRNATRAVFLTLQGMGLILVEMAINAALDAVRSVVNAAIGFALI
jgi:hypothetical protein